MGILLFMLVAGIALAAVCVYAFVIDDKESEVAGGASSSDDFLTKLQTLSPTPSPPNYLDGPPADIIGRCSPSNLPASLQACMTACSAAICCYPSPHLDTRRSCLDEDDKFHIDACQKFRPYCDLVHDTWSGATEGVIRAPPTNLVLMCAALGADNSTDATADNDPGQYVEDSAGNDTLGTPSTASFKRKRIRGHNETIPPPRRRRMNNAEAPSQICHQHCMSAQCCRASTSVVGLTLSSSGIYTNVVNGDYALTNCRAGGFGRNEEICNEYDKFCNHSMDLALTSSPSTTNEPSMSSTASVMINGTDWPTQLPTFSTSPTETTIPSAIPTVSTSPTSTLIPTAVPTDSTSPTKTSMSMVFEVDDETSSSLPAHLFYPTPPPAVLPAPSFEIAAACSGDENFEMISSNITTAREQCSKACNNGLCCFAEQLGYGSWVKSCYDGNEEICKEYSPCLVLSKGNDILTNSTASADVISTNLTEDVGGGELLVEASEPTHNSSATLGEELGLTVVASANLTEGVGGGELSVEELQADINTTSPSSEEEEEAASSPSGGDNVNED